MITFIQLVYFYRLFNALKMSVIKLIIPKCLIVDLVIILKQSDKWWLLSKKIPNHKGTFFCIQSFVREDR